MHRFTRWSLLGWLVLAAAGAPAAQAQEPPPEAAPRPAPAANPKGSLGIELCPAWFLKESDRARLGLKPGDGIVLNHTVKGGPAFLAGARWGDVVQKFAGRELPPAPVPADLADEGAIVEGYERWLAEFRASGIEVTAGAEVDLLLQRDGKSLALKVKAIDEPTFIALLQAYAKERYPDAPADPQASPGARPRGVGGLGMQWVGQLTPGWRRLLGSVPDEGLVVTRVIPGSPAAVAGLRRGDLVKRYGGKPPPDTKAVRADTPDAARLWQEAFKALVGERHAGDQLEVEVERAGKPLVVTLTLVERATLERASYVAGEGNRF